MLAEISPTRLGTVACYTLEMSFYSVPIAQKSWSSAMSDDACYEGFGGVLGRAFVDLFERGDNPKAAAIMRRVARAAEVKRALDDARKSDDGDGDGDVGDDGGTKGPGRATAARRRRRFTSRGTPCSGSGAARSRANTVSEPSTARNARRARVRRARTSAVFPAACPFPSPLPRDGTSSRTSRARPSARISPRRRVERNRTSDEIATQTAPEPRSPRVDVPRRPSRSRRFGIDATARARVFDVVVVAKRGRVRETRGGDIAHDGQTQPVERRGGGRRGPPWECAAAYLRVRARARNRRRRGARPDFASTPLAARRCSRVFDWAARAKVRVMKGDATVAASGSASSPADDPQRWGALPRERRDGETRFGEKSARERVDPEGPFGLDAELAAAQAHFEASREGKVTERKGR